MITTKIVACIPTYWNKYDCCTNHPNQSHMFCYGNLSKYRAFERSSGYFFLKYLFKKKNVYSQNKNIEHFSIMMFRIIWNISESKKRSQTFFCQFWTKHSYQKLNSRLVLKPSWLWAFFSYFHLLFPILPLCSNSSFCLDSKQNDWITQLSNIVPFIYSFHSFFLVLLPSCKKVQPYNK